MLSTCNLLAVPCCSSSPPSCHTVVPHMGEERQEDDSMGWMFPALQLCQWLDFESCVCKGDLKVQLAATGMSVGMFLKTFSGLAFHHSVSHKHISSTQRSSSSYKWLSPTKAAVSEGYQTLPSLPPWERAAHPYSQMLQLQTQVKPLPSNIHLLTP